MPLRSHLWNKAALVGRVGTVAEPHIGGGHQVECKNSRESEWSFDGCQLGPMRLLIMTKQPSFVLAQAMMIDTRMTCVGGKDPTASENVTFDRLCGSYAK